MSALGVEYNMMRVILVFVMMTFAMVAHAKDVTIYTNLQPGTNPDLYARALAAYIKDNIPNVDNTNVVNKVAAGGAGIKYYYDEAKHDSLTFGIFGFLLNYVHIDRELDKKYVDNSEIFWSKAVQFGSFGSAATSIDSILRENRQINIGIIRNLGPQTIIDRIGYDILKVRYKAIPGYPSGHVVTNALRIGELDAVRADEFDSVFSAQFLETGIAKPLWHIEYNDDAYALSNVYTRLYGKKPSGIEWEAYMVLSELNMLGGSTLVQYTPPGMKRDERMIAEIHKVILKMSQDPNILSNNVGKNMFNKHTKLGRDLNTIVKDFKVSPAVLKYLEEYDQ